VITEDLAQADIKLQMRRASSRKRRAPSSGHSPLHHASRQFHGIHRAIPNEGVSRVVYLIPAAPPLSPNSSAKSWTRWRSKRQHPDNARLVEYERQRQRLEQELSIARDIQQPFPPRFRDFPLSPSAALILPCLSVGGDYFVCSDE